MNINNDFLQAHCLQISQRFHKSYCGERRKGGWGREGGRKGERKEENTAELNEFLLNNIMPLNRDVSCEINFLRYYNLKNANTAISLLAHLDSER